MKHFLTIADLHPEEAVHLVNRAAAMKRDNWRSYLLRGKTVLLIFEKASTRTRISFEVAVNHLGGSTIFMTAAESQLGRNEPLRDTARVVSRYADALVMRTFGQEKLDELVRYGSIPIINALTDLEHPCQVMSDILTIKELTPDLSALTISWIGDGNNMAHSWINAAAIFGFRLQLACPQGYMPQTEIINKAKAGGARIELTHDPKIAVKNAHYINTDVWASMGQEEEQIKRQQAFAGFLVDETLLALATPEAKIMHCLPAHRGEEISETVLEGKQSIVWEQAENRLHMQKAILEWVMLDKIKEEEKNEPN